MISALTFPINTENQYRNNLKWSDIITLVVHMKWDIPCPQNFPVQMCEMMEVICQIKKRGVISDKEKGKAGKC